MHGDIHTKANNSNKASTDCSHACAKITAGSCTMELAILLQKAIQSEKQKQVHIVHMLVLRLNCFKRKSTFIHFSTRLGKAFYK